jgi:NADPH-dependent glutamate synthase beta subunit-like oxidoreductase
VAADKRGEVLSRTPPVPARTNGTRIACVGAGPASLTVARELAVPRRQQAVAKFHICIEWLATVAFGHAERFGKRVIVLGCGNTAVDCCRSPHRLGGEDVKAIVRSGFEEMTASPWEQDDAMREGLGTREHLSAAEEPPSSDTWTRPSSSRPNPRPTTPSPR